MPQILNIDDAVQKLYEDYVAERINGDVSLLAPVKKQNNKMYMSGNKTHKFKIRDKIVDLKETKDLYGRLMVLARSNRYIDQKQAVGTCQYTRTPRVLFSPNGSVLPCKDKSKLIHVLEKLTTRETTEADQQSDEDPIETDADPPDHRRKIAVVDGMVLVQKMTTKPATVVAVKDLSVCFNDRLMNLTRSFDEVILVFDTYKTDSRKSTTRQKRRKGKDPVQYQVRDETSISHIIMIRFLSHEQTTADLTEYLAEKTLDYNKDSSKLVITSAAGHTMSNKDVGPFPDNNHEEADPLMICLGVSAKDRNSRDVEMTLFSPDTDVLALSIASYDLLPKNTSISMVSGVQQIKPLWTALGPEKAKTLPVCHAFSGADNTGRFARIGKATWFKLFLESDDDVIRALCMLCDDTDVTEDFLQSTLARFVCTAYCTKGLQISSIPELRWRLFCKYMAESEKLLSTMGALKQHILRTHVQARVWGQAAHPKQVPLDPLQNSYHKDHDDGQLNPTTTDVPPARNAIIEMVGCQCKGNWTSNRCSCKLNN